MAVHSSSPAVLLCILCATAQLCLLISGTEQVGFSVELIHRDSPESPFHDPTATPSDRILAAVKRSAARASNQFVPNSRLLASGKLDISSSVINYNYEFLMRFEIGTPPKKVLAVLDIGSDLTWLQCDPCDNCYKHEGSIFKPGASSTYKFVPCKSDSCSSLRRDSCGADPLCKYHYIYGDNSFVDGFLSTETLTLDSSAGNGQVQLQRIVFGCTHNSFGKFAEGGVGQVGLGGGNLSLLQQMGPVTGKKFSYCLPLSPSKSTSITRNASRFYFGSAANVASGSAAVTTPLFSSDLDSFRHIIHESIRVGKASRKPIPVKRKHGPIGPLESGNMIIHSGTSLTFIDDEAMKAVSKKVVEFSSIPPVEVPADLKDVVDLCFDWRKATSKTRMPKIALNFAGGATVQLRTANAYFMANKETACLAISSNVHNSGISVLGSLAQMNFRVVFDLDAGTLTFVPEEC